MHIAKCCPMVKREEAASKFDAASSLYPDLLNAADKVRQRVDWLTQDLRCDFASERVDGEAYKTAHRTRHSSCAARTAGCL